MDSPDVAGVPKGTENTSTDQRKPAGRQVEQQRHGAIQRLLQRLRLGRKSQTGKLSGEDAQQALRSLAEQPNNRTTESRSRGKTRYPAISPQERDSQNSDAWERYTDRQKLQTAWSTPDHSPYARYQKHRTIDSIGSVADDIRPRLSPGDRVTVQEIQRMIDEGHFDAHTAVILNSGGAHSVQMAAELVTRLGYQPVVMLDSLVVENGSVPSGEELAGLLYNAARMDQARGSIHPDAPPVFIMDAHRNDFRGGKVDNSHKYRTSDLPTAEELIIRGITRIVYLDEADYKGEVVREDTDSVQQDIRPALDGWISGGIEFFRTGISPYPEQRAKARQESKLRYQDMPPSAFAGGKGVAMHLDHHRYIVGEDGKIQTISEAGIARGLTDDELALFRAQIELQLQKDPDNEAFRQALTRFTQRPSK